MKKQVLYMATVLALAVCNSASADLVDVYWQLSPYQHPDGLHTTFQIYASFSDAGDQISAVNGLDEPGLNTLDFWTSDGSDITNTDLFEGTPFNDFPLGSLGGPYWDSYVTIGATSFPSFTQFTPDFLGDWGGVPPPVQVILGSSFSETDGAWFYFGAPPAVGDLPDAVKGNETFDIVIAQFTVDAGSNVHLNGNIEWLNALSGFSKTPFSITTPAPGVLAMLCLAGLVGIRRNRW